MNRKSMIVITREPETWAPLGSKSGGSITVVALAHPPQAGPLYLLATGPKCRGRQPLPAGVPWVASPAKRWNLLHNTSRLSRCAGSTGIQLTGQT